MEALIYNVLWKAASRLLPPWKFCVLSRNNLLNSFLQLLIILSLVSLRDPSLLFTFKLFEDLQTRLYFLPRLVSPGFNFQVFQPFFTGLIPFRLDYCSSFRADLASSGLLPLLIPIAANTKNTKELTLPLLRALQWLLIGFGWKYNSLKWSKCPEASFTSLYEN